MGLGSLVARVFVVFVSTPMLCMAGGERAWDRFRGANGSGVADGDLVPGILSPETAEWRTELAPGFSSPVLGSSCVFITGGEQRDLFTYCVDPDSGDVRWRAPAPSRNTESQGPNSTASSTPTTDGDNVYVFFEHFGVISYDKDGKQRWVRELGPFAAPYGMGSSPILAVDRLLMLCDQDVGSFLVSVDKDSGE